MDKTEAAGAVVAGLGVLQPTRSCTGCDAVHVSPGHVVLLPIGQVGAVVLYFCSERCDTPLARFTAIVSLKVRGVERMAAEIQPKAEA
jgi:hypothetical protein